MKGDVLDPGGTAKPLQELTVTVAALLHSRAVQGPLQEGRQGRHLAVPQESNTQRRHLPFSLLQHLLEPSLQHSSIPNPARADTELGTAGTRETQLQLTFPKPTQAPSVLLHRAMSQVPVDAWSFPSPFSFLGPP